MSLVGFYFGKDLAYRRVKVLIPLVALVASAIERFADVMAAQCLTLHPQHPFNFFEERKRFFIANTIIEQFAL